MQVLQIFSPNHWPGRAGHMPSWIIVHGTAGFETAGECAAYFGSTASQVSAHYVIGRDGTVIQCVDESDSAWANGIIDGLPVDLGFREFGDGVHRDAWWTPSLNPNLVTISIEHVKPSSDNSDQLTEAQQAASFQLVSAICDRWKIPKRFADANGGITGHFSIEPGQRSHCPGPYPWSSLFQYLNQGDSMLDISQAAQFFQETVKDQRWHCKQTGFDIAFAILDYYRTCSQTGLNGITEYGLPLSGEEHVPNTKQAVEQYFERGVIRYDPAHEVDSAPGAAGPCYSAHLNDGRVLQRYLQLVGNQPLSPGLSQQAIDTTATALQNIVSAARTGLQALGKAS